MREWFSKWEKVIIWVVAVVFVGGIIWWSIAEYIGVSQSAQQRNAAARDAEVVYGLPRNARDLSGQEVLHASGARQKNLRWQSRRNQTT